MRGLFQGRRRAQAAAVLAALEALSPLPAREEALERGGLLAETFAADRREASQSPNSALEGARASRPGNSTGESIRTRGQGDLPASPGEGFSTPSPAWEQGRIGGEADSKARLTELDRLLERDARRYEREFTLY